MLAAVLRIPLCAALGLAWMLVAALYGRPRELGVLGTVGSWSLGVLYAGIGVAGGALIGALAVGRRGFAACEAALRDRLQQAVGAVSPERIGLAATMPLSELRERYDQSVDRMVAESIGRVPLPGIVHRWFRARIRQAVLGDFLEDCERRRAQTVDAAQVAAFLLGKGLALAAEPAYRWFRLWQWLVLAALAVLGAAPLVLRLTG